MRVQREGFYCNTFGYCKPVPNYAVVLDEEEECCNGGQAPTALCLHRTEAGAERCLAYRANNLGCVCQ